METVIDPVPVTELAASFSPMPRMAPPPFGRELHGKEGPFCAAVSFRLHLSVCSLEDLSRSLLAFILSFPVPWGETTRTMNDGAARRGCRCMLQLALDLSPNRAAPN